MRPDGGKPETTQSQPTVNLMSKKDYVRIAAAIARLSLKPEDRNNVVRVLSEVMSEDNPRFDWRRFYDACQPKAQARE